MRDTEAICAKCEWTQHQIPGPNSHQWLCSGLNRLGCFDFGLF